MEATIEVARSTVAANTAPSIPEADFASYIANTNQFGLALHQAQSRANKLTDTNLIYSPISVSMALAMTYAGARGTTASEMKAVLGDSFAGGTFHVASNRLARELRSRATSRTGSDGTVHELELNLVDAIFVERTLALEQPFLDLLAREYESGVSQLDFMRAFEPARMTINDWVAMQTKDRILELLPMGAITPATRLVLVNALYLYGSWQAAFNAAATRDAAFKNLAGATVQTPTMYTSYSTGYALRENYAAADLPYEGGSLSMTIVLPRQGQFEAVRSQVSETWLKGVVSALQPALLQIGLPKFKVTSGTFSLKSGLEELGMRAPFKGEADFGGIANTPLVIHDVLQKAFIAVDEDGTEAAAATAVIVGPPDAAPVTPTPFLVDRPFLFFIRDKNGSVLFSGHVVDPTQ